MIVDTGPKCRRFVRGNSDFDLCVNIGQKGYVVAEHPDIVGEVDKLIEQSAAVEEKLTIVNQLLSVSES